MTTSPFLSEFRNWSQDFWSLVHFLKTESEEYQDEFLEISQSLRRQFIRSRLLRQPWTQHDFPKRFFQLWRTKIKSISKRTGIGLENGQEENAFLEQVFLFSLVQKDWSLEKVAFWTQIPVEALKKRTFNSLLKFSQLKPVEKIYLDRDCIKNDLYRLDFVLQLKWKDPLNLYSVEHHVKHANRCVRCMKVNSAIETSLRDLKNKPKLKPSEEFSEVLEREMNSSFKFVSMDGLTLWPWYLKTPVQMAVMSLVLFGLMSIPYVGDFFPHFRRTHLSSWVESLRQLQGDLYTRWESIRNYELISSSEKPPEKAAEVSKVEIQPEKVTEIVVAKTEAKIVPEKTVVAPKPTSQPQVERKAEAVPTAVSPARVFFRWGAFSRDLKLQTTTVLEILAKYGAVKSGDLALGAQYKGGSYFHFAVKEENFDALVEEIKKIGLIDFTQSSAKSDRATEVGFKRVVFLMVPN
jgi:hypothetical protein